MCRPGTLTQRKSLLPVSLRLALAVVRPRGDLSGASAGSSMEQARRHVPFLFSASQPGWIVRSPHSPGLSFPISCPCTRLLTRVPSSAVGLPSEDTGAPPLDRMPPRVPHPAFSGASVLQCTFPHSSTEAPTGLHCQQRPSGFGPTSRGLTLHSLTPRMCVQCLLCAGHVLTSRDGAVKETLCSHWRGTEVNQTITEEMCDDLSFVCINALKKNKIFMRSYYKQTMKARHWSLRKQHGSCCVKVKWGQTR